MKKLIFNYFSKFSFIRLASLMLMISIFVTFINPLKAQISRFNDLTVIEYSSVDGGDPEQIATMPPINAPCNLGCANGGFENNGSSTDFGNTRRYHCGTGPVAAANPGSDNPVINRACVRTTNKSQDKYWWTVDHLSAINNTTTNCNVGSPDPCIVYLSSTTLASVDLITSSAINGTNNTYSFNFDGNPDQTWSPLDEDNDHYMRFITRDGLRVTSSSSGCSQTRYLDYNEYSEGMEVATINISSPNDNHPNLTAGQTYVVEFYASYNGFLETATGNVLPTPDLNQFNIRYFVGPMPSSSTSCDPNFIEYVSTSNGCQYNTGRFQAGANCSPTWTLSFDNYETETWVHVVQTFVAPISGRYGVFFSPITEPYHGALECETAYYFVDDVYITPSNSNPISAELSIQGNSGPIINWNGYYQIPLDIFVQFDNPGTTNNAPVTIQLDLPPGITYASQPGWVGNTYTFPIGSLNATGTTLSALLNINSSVNSAIINEIGITATSGCLNHRPIIGIDFECTTPQVIFTNFLYCSGNPSILASIQGNTLQTANIQGFWDGPGSYVDVGLTADNAISGAYVFTLYNSVCSSNFNHSITVPTPGSYVVLGATTVNNQTTFDLTGQAVVYTGDVTINAGFTWDVTNSEVYFHSDKRIKVLPNGNLSGNNSTFNAACPNAWRGIEVQGQLGQAEVESPAASPHGTCVLKACSVKNAYLGVSAQGYQGSAFSYDTNTRGGLVVLSNNCNFVNNRQDLDFQPTTTQSNSIRRSRISDTNFLLDPNYWISYVPTSRINHSSNCGVRYAGVVVRNTDPSRVIGIQNFTGINLSNSKIELVCDITNPLATSCNKQNFIEGFVYGIRAVRSSAPGNVDMRVHYTNFKCHRGFYSQGAMSNCYTLDNDFFKLPSNFTSTPNCNSSQPYIGPGTVTYVGRYGAYFEGAHPTNIIEGNTFNGNFSQDQLTHIGLVVNGNGANSNTVYGNQFANLSHGISFYGVNRSTQFADVGMKFACNQYTNNGQDNLLSSSGGSASPPASSGLGISRLQGSSSVSAGNKFTSALPLNTDDINEMFNTVQDHQYFFKNTGSTENYNTSETNMTSFQSTDFNLCTPLNLQQLTTNNQELLFENLNLLYMGLKDGGDTESLLTEIENSTYSEATELYYELMSKSPNLSEEALILATMKEYELPTMLLTLILQNNPQAAKSEKLNEALDNRLMPLEEWQQLLVAQGKTWLSDLENVRSEISETIKNYYRALADELASIKNSELSDLEKDELIVNTLSNMEFPNNNLMLAVHQLSVGRIEESKNVLDQIAFSLSSDDFSRLDLLTYKELMDYEFSSESNNESIEIGQIDHLTSLAENSYLPISSSISSALLTQIGYEIHEPLYNEINLKSTQTLTNEFVKNETTKVNDWLQVSPNPASDYVAIRFERAPISAGAKLNISDLQGREVAQQNIASPDGLQSLDVRSLANGVYSITVMDMGFALTTKKLIVNR